jgi:hypothetical protein
MGGNRGMRGKPLITVGRGLTNIGSPFYSQSDELSYPGQLVVHIRDVTCYLFARRPRSRFGAGQQGSVALANGSLRHFAISSKALPPRGEIEIW